MEGGLLRNNTPRGRCDACGHENVARWRYRVIRVNEEGEESRTVLVCANDRKPLEKLLAIVPPKLTGGMKIQVEKISDLKPSKTLRAQIRPGATKPQRPAEDR